MMAVCKGVISFLFLSLENVVNLIYFMTGANLNVVLTEYFGIGDLCPAQSSLTEARWSYVKI